VQLWHSPFFDGGVENCPSSVGLYRVFNPLALWALPLYSLQEHRGSGLKSGLFPYAVFVPRHAAGHGKGRRGVNLLLCVLRSKI